MMSCRPIDLVRCEVLFLVAMQYLDRRNVWLNNCLEKAGVYLPKFLCERGPLKRKSLAPGSCSYRLECTIAVCIYTNRGSSKASASLAELQSLFHSPGFVFLSRKDGGRSGIRLPLPLPKIPSSTSTTNLRKIKSTNVATAAYAD